MLPFSPLSTLISSLDWGQMPLHDPLQNPDQTWIFYKMDETHLTCTVLSII